jgi:hypothetical protein
MSIGIPAGKLASSNKPRLTSTMQEILMSRGASIPRNAENDYSSEQASARRDFVKEQTGASLDMVGNYTFDPEATRGNIKNFIGVVQMPLGVVRACQPSANAWSSWGAAAQARDKLA